MLTSILSAVCALVLSSNSIASQGDTLNVYIIDGEKIENFDGSQLVGKTVSDYKTMTSSSTSNGVTSVTKMHIIHWRTYRSMKEPRKWKSILMARNRAGLLWVKSSLKRFPR